LDSLLFSINNIPGRPSITPTLGTRDSLFPRKLRLQFKFSTNGFFLALFVTAAAGCRTDLRIALLDQPAVTAGAISMIGFPQGRFALILLPQMTLLAADFLAFDINELACFFVPLMMAEPAASIRQRLNMFIVGKADGRSSQLAVNISVFQDILILLGHRTGADDEADQRKSNNDQPDYSVFSHRLLNKENTQPGGVGNEY
jgi:hypothetical protein